MRKLLHFEFHKLLRQKSMRVCSIILVCLSALSLLMAKAFWDNGGSQVVGAVIPTATSLTISALSSASFSLILAIFTAIFICEDKSEGILKNIYAKGYDRTKVFFAKMIAVCTYCIVMAITCYAISFIGGLIMFPFENVIIVKGLTVLPIQLILMIAYTCLFGLIATFSKKSGSAIAGCIVAPMLVALVIGLVDAFSRLESFNFSTYWLEDMFSAVNSQNATTNSLIIGGVGGVIYALIFIVLGVFISKKTEV